MNPMRVDGEVECELGEVVQETPEARRRRLNRERMRRNRTDPGYRAREQLRQRQRRRERLMMSKLAKHIQRTPPRATLTRHFFQGNMPWLREMHEASCARQTPCVVALPMSGYPGCPGCSVLPPTVALSVMPGMTSNISVLVVADDGVQSGTAIPVTSALEPSVDVKTPVHLSKILNLDRSGGFWYSNETPSYDAGCVNVDEPVVKREY